MSGNEGMHTPKKTLFTTPNPFEKQFGYHRAVRRGPFISVSGTTALKFVDLADTSGPSVEYPGDAYEQARLSMSRCLEAVKKLGGSCEDIIRVRMFVAQPEDCSNVGRAFKETFGTPRHADGTDDIVGASATMIVVNNGFVDAEILVEVEVDAYCLS